MRAGAGREIEIGVVVGAEHPEPEQALVGSDIDQQPLRQAGCNLVQLRLLRGLGKSRAAVGIEQEGIVDAEPQPRRCAQIEVLGGLQLGVGRERLGARIATPAIEQVGPVSPGTGDIVVEQRLRLWLGGQPCFGVLHD